jgi:hypothetical protein
MNFANGVEYAAAVFLEQIEIMTLSLFSNQ